MSAVLCGVYAYKYGVSLKLSNNGLIIEPVSKFDFWMTVVILAIAALIVVLI